MEHRVTVWQTLGFAGNFSTSSCRDMDAHGYVNFVLNRYRPENLV